MIGKVNKYYHKLLNKKNHKIMWLFIVKYSILIAKLFLAHIGQGPGCQY